MKIIYEAYGTRYTVETEHDDHNADELKEIFSRVLIQAGFPPSVAELDDGGSYEYVAEDEVVVKREELEK